MRRLAKLDISAKFQGYFAQHAAQIAFGIGCAVTMIVLRSALNYWAPTAGPFALVYPTVLIATLFGHWLGGITAYGISFVWAWWLVLPTVRSFHFEIPSDPPRVLINALACLVIIVFAEAFRRAVQDAVSKRDLEIERRAILMKELEHRTKNNFSMVASLLEMQKRGLEEDEAIAAIDQAIGRVHTFASAYSIIIPNEALESEDFPVDMDKYLKEIVNQLSSAAFAENIRVSIEAESYSLPHRVAVAIGLFVNEALTNCAKYAFPDGQAGTIHIAFWTEDGEWRLVVSDDGIGQIERTETEGKSVGKILMNAFAVQAGANYDILETARGYSVGLRGSPEVAH